ncbi:MAG: LysM peptidoglycan-binding domain-containing protein [Bacteroidia bacterium]|nr:MAG: LysM peptidoglycan-binding domain-containing protein [Bacteroidia bacterium]
MILFPNRNKLILLLGVFLMQSLAGQDPVTVERTTNKVILEGTVYYIHVVKPGQTLYAISRAYNISQKEIAIENPGVVSGIQIGQSLKIPVEPSLVDEVDTSEGLEQGEAIQIHIVEKGETLYGIARKYGVTEEVLMQANRGVTARNLKNGQRLIIPLLNRAEEDPVYNEQGIIYHKVKRRETLYSIAGYYQVSVEDIRAANPELGWGGPKNGQVIRIPEPQVTGQPQSIQDTISGSGSIYAGSDLPMEVYGYAELASENYNINRTYQVAFFVPFDFRKSEPLDSLLKDVSSETRRSRITERYLNEQRIPQSVQFLEFFQGSLLALDSMRQMGMKLDVRYYDTRKSMSQTLSILRDDELEDFDLFIGPFYPYTLEIVSEFARKHKIPLVTPFNNDLDLVKQNPYLFQMSPSIEREYREAAKLVASKHDYNIVYVRQEDSLDIEKHEYYKQLIFDGFDDYHPTEPVVFKEVVLSMERIITLEQTQEIIHSLSSDKKNLVLIPTSNVSLASPVVSALRFQLRNFDIELLGSPNWIGSDFSSIDYRDYHNLNLIFYSSFWVDYHDPVVDAYLAKYRSHFYNEPTFTSKKGLNYGIAGYDMTLYFLNALRTYGSRFILSLDEYHPELIQGSIHFDRLSRGGGYENANITFYQFTPDMTIHKIDVPELPQPNYFFRPVDEKKDWWKDRQRYE